MAVPRFFVDESALGVGKILARARPDVVYPGHPWLPDIPTGTKDPDWMPRVAELGLVVISRDVHIRSRPAELELFRRHALRAFWIAGKRDEPMSNWKYLTRLVRYWEAMERLIEERGPGPWFYALNENAVTEIILRGT